MSDAHGSDSSARLQDLLPDPSSVRRQLSAFGPSVTNRVRLLQRRFQLGSDDAGEGALDPSYIEDGAEAVTEEDIDTVVEKADAIEERFQKNGPLRRLMTDGRLLLGLIQDVRRGHYRQVPVWTLSAAAFTLLYVLNPFDAIPDAIPLVGVLDDAAVVSASLVLLEQDLYEYKMWLQHQAEENSVSNATESRTESADETSG